jgi:hypothetical protein
MPGAALVLLVVKLLVAVLLGRLSRLSRIVCRRRLPAQRGTQWRQQRQQQHSSTGSTEDRESRPQLACALPPHCAAPVSTRVPPPGPRPSHADVTVAASP